MASLFNIMTSADNDSKFKKGQTVQATISQVTEEGLQVLLPFLKREIPVPKEELDCDEYNVYDYMSQIGETIDLTVANSDRF
ncbi:MAG: S1 RNA-binding domain-containing protein [Clostridia bacterium]|uniref:S1 RNA-binding domain-containing protein n=1 Tax=Dubosiella newyorkensis TaxID=1862672 RepID=UPI0025ACBEA8|nr:S1 RNA-binding domain-containing protein [Dubosiella newyorkensis]MCI9407009.1 S1 RNA-binding domain-containing protein [Clostridia bacterium]